MGWDVVPLEKILKLLEISFLTIRVFLVHSITYNLNVTINVLFKYLIKDNKGVPIFLQGRRERKYTRLLTNSADV